ncbi:hypothetical protein PTSG_01598 [Salpingoeca rosetta]|uniref:DEAD/DEAH box helicase n=1 Tax=Salpingoeca rosetta (strain ATCC 50818 / BSB-021) TaxID=946362 RepID=F2TYE6_SALR5|nr:uncharacterized protein PTSG_01598 [Salpingoeca rosetta]EGD78620.1 hypothetical protein PTSG_01598 [Salpingoeca rosetta]|eukprot:XP_004997578.1 hypothetical protein PTSG_01598 [Salpingoeca rosetta]
MTKKTQRGAGSGGGGGQGRRRKKKEKEKLDFGASGWPAWCQQLLSVQEKVESVAAFLNRRHMVLDADVIARTAGCDKHDIARIVAMLPEQLELRWKTTIANSADDSYAGFMGPPTSSSSSTTHPARPTPLQLVPKMKRPFTKGSTMARQRALVTAMHKHIANQHQEFLDAISTLGGRDDDDAATRGAPSDSTAGDLTSPAQFHPDFDLSSLPPPLPAVVESIEEQEKREAEESKTASVQYTNYTGDYRATPPAQFDPKEILDHLLRLPLAKGHSLHVETLPARAPVFGELERPLPSPLQHTLADLGIQRLFSHQAEGVNAARDGAHVMISTATSSGKSLVYHLPTMEALLSDPHNTVALYIFPTKALAQDQLRSLREFVGAGWLGDAVRADCLDADTPARAREDVKSAANIILTNPDLLHATLLPRHRDWHRIFRSLRFVVIDEAHMYRGAFGSHVSLVIRRLLRICRHYGNTSVQFICSTATLANPRQHFGQLIPLIYPHRSRVCVVDNDGSPSGSRVFVLWNPVRNDNSTVDGSADVFHPPEIATAAASATAETTTSTHTAHGAHAAVPCTDVQRPVPLHPPILPSPPPSSSSSSTTASSSSSSKSSSSSTTASKPPSSLFRAGQAPPSPKRAHVSTPSTRTRAAPATAQSDSVPPLSSPPASSSSVLLPPPHTTSHARVPTAGDSERHISSAILQAALILSALVKQHVRTLAFAKVRKVTELVLKYTRHDLKHTAPQLVARVKSYRAGYTKEERRAIERALFAGKILGTTATNALELGVDIGSLDATILLGFPGSIASMWQQAGRSGRGTHDALTILILFNSPLDQYYHRHPTQLFARKYEAAVCDPRNPYVLREHLVCAAAELPLALLPTHIDTTTRLLGADVVGEEANFMDRCTLDEYTRAFPAMEDLLLFGGTAPALVHTLEDSDIVLQTREGFTIRAMDARPSLTVSLRSVDQEAFAVYEIPGMKKIDEVGPRHAIFELYEGAIFLHQGHTFLITHYDRDELVAHAKPVKVDYFTRQRDFSNIDVINVLKRDPERNAFWGSVQVSVSVYGYHKIRERTLEFFETVPLVLDPWEYKSRGCWIDIHPSVKYRLLAEGLDVTASIHAANHVIKNSVPVYVLCDLGDIDCEHSSPLQLRARPLRLVLYDTKPGGIGVCFAAYEMVHQIAQTALELVRDCPCSSGCPGCIHDFACSEYNQCTSKAGAHIVLEDICLQMAKQKCQQQQQQQQPASSAGKEDRGGTTMQRGSAHD